jgi:hypothetical protein
VLTAFTMMEPIVPACVVPKTFFRAVVMGMNTTSS